MLIPSHRVTAYIHIWSGPVHHQGNKIIDIHIESPPPSNSPSVFVLIGINQNKLAVGRQQVDLFWESENLEQSDYASCSSNAGERITGVSSSHVDEN